MAIVLFQLIVILVKFNSSVEQAKLCFDFSRSLRMMINDVSWETQEDNENEL